MKPLALFSVGQISGMGWVTLEGRVTANQYKPIPTDLLYSVVKHVSSDGSGLF